MALSSHCPAWQLHLIHRTFTEYLCHSALPTGLPNPTVHPLRASSLHPSLPTGSQCVARVVVSLLTRAQVRFGGVSAHNPVMLGHRRRGRDGNPTHGGNGVSPCKKDFPRGLLLCHTGLCRDTFIHERTWICKRQESLPPHVTMKKIECS